MPAFANVEWRKLASRGWGFSIRQMLLDAGVPGVQDGS